VTVLRWTEQAVDDLEAIRDYVARDSEHYAALLVERLVGALDQVVPFPEIGRMVPEYGRPDLRELIVGSYRVVYRLKSENAEVLTVFHGARLFPADVEAAL
jgi:addiction module RelE/StbE family toxin